MYNKLFTYTSKNILIIMVIILSVLLGSNELSQVFECPVAVCSEIGEDNLPAQHEGCYVLLTGNKLSN